MRKSPQLEAALDAAAAAATIIRRSYRANVAVRTKADKSPVTDADVEAERAIRAVLEARFPGYGFHGEETGQHDVQAEYVWLVDPIDGTKAFVREYSMFSTQIALMRQGRLQLGVSLAPVYGETAWAERGAGAWLNGERVAVSDIADVEEASLSAGNLKTLASGPRWAGFGRLVARADRTRGYGDFLHYHLLAAGRLEAVLESDIQIYDVAALAVIVEEAGGRVTELDGSPLGPASTTILASNGALHETLLAALAA